jgi:Na+/citrate or Na+/malate symporter
MNKFKTLVDCVAQLYKPVADSVAGKINAKEAGLALLLAAAFFIAGGRLDDLIKYTLAAFGVGYNPEAIMAALVALVVAIIHRKEQKA